MSEFDESAVAPSSPIETEIQASKDALKCHFMSGDKLKEEMNQGSLPTRETLLAEVSEMRYLETRAPISHFLSGRFGDIDGIVDGKKDGALNLNEISAAVKLPGDQTHRFPLSGEVLKPLIEDTDQLLDLQQKAGTSQGDVLTDEQRLAVSIGAENYRKGIMNLMGLAAIDECFYGLRNAGDTSNDTLSVKRDIEPLIGNPLLLHDKDGLKFQSHLQEAVECLKRRGVESLSRDDLRKIIKEQSIDFNNWVRITGAPIIQADKLTMPREVRNYINKIIQRQ